ncbi:hypothetical protein SAMN05216357_1288 [Porphyromonadaceae bacterium KH3CP3RA]|nr:hypothetical protein SAMN05216357_1288 [Porphyromonadaceae bacterium KH3CP3RA]
MFEIIIEIIIKYPKEMVILNIKSSIQQHEK